MYTSQPPCITPLTCGQLDFEHVANERAAAAAAAAATAASAAKCECRKKIEQKFEIK
jgi:hypothetical protein